MTVSDVPAAFLEVAEAFAADRVESWPDPDTSLWRFWNFEFLVDGDSFGPLGKSFGWFNPYRTRGTINGLADELGRHNLCVGYWYLGVTATVHNGRLGTASVWLATEDFRRTARGKLPWVGVRREYDPLGWPIAVGALYTRTVEPLIDYLIESPLYESHHDRLADAVGESQCSV